MLEDDTMVIETADLLLQNEELRAKEPELIKIIEGQRYQTESIGPSHTF